MFFIYKMTSLSGTTSMDNQLYNNQLAEYFASRAQAPTRDLKKEMEDQQQNELLDAFTAPVAAHFIDSGLENVKDYVKQGFKKAVNKGVETGKDAVKSGVKQIAKRAGISEETADDLLSGRLNMTKSVSQATDYIKQKASQAAADATAQARSATGQITDQALKAGEDARSAAAQARGLASNAVQSGEDALADTSKAVQSTTGEKSAMSRFLDRAMGRNPTADSASKPLWEQSAKDLSSEFTDPFTGKTLDMKPKFSAPAEALFDPDEDLSVANEGLTNATNVQKLGARAGSQLEKFKVLQSETQNLGELGRKNVLVQGDEPEEAIGRLNKVFQYQKDVAQQAKDLGSDLGKFTGRVQPSAVAKASASLDDVATQAESKVTSGLKPSYRLLADMFKNASSEEPVSADLASGLEELKGAGEMGRPSTFAKTIQQGKNALRSVIDSFGDSRASTGTVADNLGREFMNPAFNPDDPAFDTEQEMKSTPDDPDNVEGSGANKPPADSVGQPQATEDGQLVGKAGEESGQILDTEENVENATQKVAQEGENVGKAVVKGLAEGGELDAELGGPEDPLGDLFSLGMAAATILPAVLGQKHDTSAPPPPNLTNPGVPLGI